MKFRDSIRFLKYSESESKNLFSVHST